MATGRTVWLIRHARRLDFDEPEWARTASRAYDPPLSPAGRVQAEELARHLVAAGLQHLFASPFLRCVETAAPIAERARIPLRLERGLCEWLNPEWFPEPPALLPATVLARRFPRVDPTHRSRGTAHHGESGEEALRRSGDTARRLVDEFEGNLAMVGHGASVLGGMAALLEVAPKTLPDLAYARGIELVQAGGRWIRARAGGVRADPDTV